MEAKDLCIRWLLADFTSLGSTTSKLALKGSQGVRAKLSYGFPIRITSTSGKPCPLITSAANLRSGTTMSLYWACPHITATDNTID